MPNRRKIYAALAVVFLASLGAAVFFHYFAVSVIGDLAGIPAILALFGALFQVARDSIAFDRAVRFEEGKNRFTIGATSHMANVAFDKHVLFCEEYVAEVSKALDTLVRRGPHREVLPHANNLYDIRRKWVVWVTPQIEAKLEQFEAALRTIGAQAILFALPVGSPGRSEAIQKAHKAYAEVMGLEWRVEEHKLEQLANERNADRAITRLRAVLGTDELTRLRTELVNRALENLDSPK